MLSLPLRISLSPRALLGTGPQWTILSTRSPGNCRAAARGATESEFPLDRLWVPLARLALSASSKSASTSNLWSGVAQHQRRSQFHCRADSSVGISDAPASSIDSVSVFDRLQTDLYSMSNTRRTPRDRSQPPPVSVQAEASSSPPHADEVANAAPATPPPP